MRSEMLRRLGIVKKSPEKIISNKRLKKLEPTMIASKKIRLHPDVQRKTPRIII